MIEISLLCQFLSEIVTYQDVRSSINIIKSVRVNWLSQLTFISFGKKKTNSLHPTKTLEIIHFSFFHLNEPV